VLICLHVIAQSVQGYYFYQKYNQEYDQIALSAGFIPTTFQVITKNKATITIFEDGIFQPKKKLYVIKSKEETDLEYLFRVKPEAKTLYNWAPFVVIIDDGKQLGIYDPRFYRNGQSFLYEYITR
jgi:inner membrane protein